MVNHAIAMTTYEGVSQVRGGCAEEKHTLPEKLFSNREGLGVGRLIRRYRAREPIFLTARVACDLKSQLPIRIA